MSRETPTNRGSSARFSVRRNGGERIMVRANRYAVASALDGAPLESSGVCAGESAGSAARGGRLARQHGDDGVRREQHYGCVVAGGKRVLAAAVMIVGTATASWMSARSPTIAPTRLLTLLLPVVVRRRCAASRRGGLHANHQRQHLHRPDDQLLMKRRPQRRARQRADQLSAACRTRGRARAGRSVPPNADEAGASSLGPGGRVSEYCGISPPSFGSAASGR